MLRLIDDWLEQPTQEILATDTELSIANSSKICDLLTASDDFLYLKISDGVNLEWVKVIGCTAGKLKIVRGQFNTLPSRFAYGCVASEINSAIICALIAAGGCAATTVTACDKVSLSAISLPSSITGKPYVGVITFTNATSITAIAKPAWATVTVSPGIALIGGTPTSEATEPIVLRAIGCQSEVIVNDKITTCKPVGV
jgi:hypothetical protein